MSAPPLPSASPRPHPADDPASSEALPRRRGPETTSRILDAAEALFAERGYAGTTLRDVAAAVGIRNPSLYNHFASKESLYAAVLERAMAPVIEALSGFLELGSPGDRDSRRVVERMMHVLRERPNLPRLVLHETLTGAGRLTPVLRDAIAPAFARAHAMVRATRSTRPWPEQQVPLLVMAMCNVVLGYFTMAPLVGQVQGVDLTSDAVIAEQTRFLHRLVKSLFPDELETSPAPARAAEE